MVCHRCNYCSVSETCQEQRLSQRLLSWVRWLLLAVPWVKAVKGCEARWISLDGNWILWLSYTQALRFWMWRSSMWVRIASYIRYCYLVSPDCYCYGCEVGSVKDIFASWRLFFGFSEVVNPPNLHIPSLHVMCTINNPICTQICPIPILRVLRQCRPEACCGSCDAQCTECCQCCFDCNGCAGRVCNGNWQHKYIVRI